MNKIKSPYIIKQVFENVKNRIMLNILKYNKILLDKLNITIEDYKNEHIRDFNERFQLNIKNTDVKELNLSFKNMTDKDLDYFDKYKFNQLVILNLSINKLTNIKILEKLKLEELKELNLRGNDISDINLLEKLNIKNLEKLNLSANANKKFNSFKLIINLLKGESKREDYIHIIIVIKYLI